MFRTYNSKQSIKLRPQEDLQNISFFQIGKSYDLLPSRKMRHFPYAQFSSWSEKDQEQFLSYGFNNQSYQPHGKKTADTIFKRIPHQRLRFSNSVTFQTKKIDLGAKVSESINKYHSKTKHKAFYSPNKNLPQCESEKKIQNKSEMRVKNKEIIEKIKNIVIQEKQQNPESQKQLQTQPSYSIINYPISATLIRKRKFKKFEKFPFPSLALRLNK